MNVGQTEVRGYVFYLSISILLSNPKQTVVLKDFIKSMCLLPLLHVSRDVTVYLCLHAGAVRRVRLCLCSFCEGQLLSWELVMAGIGAMKV